MIYLALLLALSGCGRDKTPTTFMGTAMTMPYKVIVGDPLSSERQELVRNAILATFLDVNASLNDWNEESEISLFNSGRQIRPSPILRDLLAQTDEIVQTTKGAFDPSIAPLYKCWRKALERHENPDKEEAAAAAGAIGWHQIEIKELMRKRHPLACLDLGGIAKGYCIDLLLHRVQNLGIHNLYVEWGGEIAACGRHPEGRAWRVFISNKGSMDQQTAIDFVDLENQAIATSGDYYQNWEADGVRYTHIVDPIHGKPLQMTEDSLTSVTVLASSCSLADALATAAMVQQTIKQADSWVRNIQKIYPNTIFWLVDRSGQKVRILVE